MFVVYDMLPKNFNTTISKQYISQLVSIANDVKIYRKYSCLEIVIENFFLWQTFNPNKPYLLYNNIKCNITKQHFQILKKKKNLIQYQSFGQCKNFLLLFLNVEI